jgi:hypothetical protein
MWAVLLCKFAHILVARLAVYQSKSMISDMHSSQSTQDSKEPLITSPVQTPFAYPPPFSGSGSSLRFDASVHLPFTAAHSGEVAEKAKADTWDKKAKDFCSPRFCTAPGLFPERSSGWTVAHGKPDNEL